MDPMGQDVLRSGGLNVFNSASTTKSDSKIDVLVDRNFVNATITFTLRLGGMRGIAETADYRRSFVTETNTVEMKLLSGKT
jgi:hypothetical protein